jgi:uncharacterized protein
MISGSPNLKYILKHLRLGILASLLILSIASTIHFMISPAPAIGLVSTNVVISEFRVRGPVGGNDEFIELYNLSSAPIDISGWKIRGSNSGGTVSDRATILAGTLIQPGCHYLLTNAAASGYSGTVPGDQTYTTGITDDGGIALTLPDNTIIDQVGMSAGSAFKEGTPLANLGTSNLNRGYERKPGGVAGSGTDTDDNSSDFQLITPSDPQSSTSGCIGSGTTNPSGIGAANPNPVSPGNTTVLTVAVTPGANPASTGIAVTGDLSQIGGVSSQIFFNDGTNGDATAGDNIFSFNALVSAEASPGLKSLPITITDAQSRTGTATISLNIQAPTMMVISQIYGAGGNSGAVLTNDFIEIFNRGTTTVDLTGWSFQYASSAGTSWQVTPLSGNLAPGQYYLVQEGSGGASGSALPAPDATGSINMAAGMGKVALVNTNTPLSGSGCPFGVTVVDFIGYGSANCFEGGGSASMLSATTAALRGRRGCRDTNNNSVDFTSGSPSPRNSSSPLNDCSVPPPLLAINKIQGNGAVTPILGQEVTTTGIVTARKSNGFFLQSPAAEADADPNSSEGIFIFTAGTPAAQVGDAVSVIGIAGEFFNLTQLSSTNLDVTILSSMNTLPPPVPLTTSILNPAGTLTQLERLEGMRVSASSLTSIAPTNEFGEIFTVLTGVPRPLREPGLENSNPLPPGSPCCIPRFDENPERLMIDTDGQIGSTRLIVTSGVTLTGPPETGVAGPLDFTFDDYKILPDKPPIVTPNITAIPLPLPNANEFTIGSFNLLNFFSTNPNFTDRLNKASLAIRTVMRSPDIIGVEEMGDIETLTTLANKINFDTVAAGSANPGYQAFLLEGDDAFPNDIDVGFLVKSSRVNVINVTQQGKGLTFLDPTEGDQDLLFERPPLVLRATVQSPTGSQFPLTIVVNHMQSLIDIDDPIRGPRQREKRRLQAEFTANLAQSLQSENLVMVGDFNSFQFSDGYVDVIGTIKGAPAPADQVVLASPDLVNPNLTVLVDTLPADQRYSFNFQGNAQAIDHVLVNDQMFARLSRFGYARNNSDYPESLSGDGTRPERISDHDMPVAYFSFPPPAADLSITLTSSPQPVLTSATLTYTINLTNNGPDHAANVVVSDKLPSSLAFTSCAASGGGVCGGTGNNLTVSFAAINAGSTETITLNALVNGLLFNGTSITNTANAVSVINDPLAGNNSATTTSTVNRSQSITPIAECVVNLGGGAFTARFGYDNLNPVAITIQDRLFNFFLPLPADRGQPKVFLPGRQREVFSVENARGILIWSLTGRTVIASPLLTPRCDQ